MGGGRIELDNKNEMNAEYVKEVTDGRETKL